MMRSGFDTLGIMIQCENQTFKVGFMMCNCGKHYGDRCEEGCERQRETLERTNAQLRNAMENLTKSYFETIERITKEIDNA